MKQITKVLDVYNNMHHFSFNTKIEVQITSRDYWVKVVEFLQQNWALVDPNNEGGFTVYFLSDVGGVFDELNFNSIEEAESALIRNGFSRYEDDKKLQEFLCKPTKYPLHIFPHPNGPIYSSGDFWI